MTLPVQVLERLAPAFSRGLGFAAAPSSSLPAARQLEAIAADEVKRSAGQKLTGLALGGNGKMSAEHSAAGDMSGEGLWQKIDALLPDEGLLRGGVVELALKGASALGTSFGLAACRAAQREGLERGGSAPWCAFLDPTRSLYAPGVLRAGVRLERLLVVCPEPEALSRSALRLVESQAFAVVVIDTVGVLGAPVRCDLGHWARIARRLALALEGKSSCVLLLTDLQARRPLPLPVAQRIEVSRPQRETLQVTVVKDRYGRVAGPRRVAWTRAELAAAPRLSA